MEVETLHVKKELVVGEGKHQMIVSASDKACYLWLGQQDGDGNHFVTLQSSDYNNHVFIGLSKDNYKDADGCDPGFDFCFCLKEDGKPWVQFVDDNRQVHMLPVKDMQEAIQAFVKKRDGVEESK